MTEYARINIKRRWQSTFLVFLLLLDLLSGLAFVRYAPPFSGFDEGWHWLRSTEISQGRLFPRRLGPNDWGDKLNAWSAELAAAAATQASSGRALWVGPLRQIASHAEAHGPHSQILSFPSTAAFPPLPYAPYAIGIALSRGVGADLLQQAYCGRVAGVLAYVALITATVWLLPVGRLPVLMLMGGPTALYLSASYSSDPLNLALPPLLIAWCLRLRLTPKASLRRWRGYVFALLVLGMGMLKLPTVVLAAVPLLVPREKFTSSRAYVLVVFGPMLGALATAALWSARYPFLPGQYFHQDIDPVRALHQIMYNPFAFAWLVLQTLANSGGDLWLHSYARFGGAPAPFNFVVGRAWFCIAMLGTFGLLFDRSGSRPDRRAAAWLTLVSAAYVLALLVAFRVAYTSPNSSIIGGLQGRYFILPQIVLVLAAALWLPTWTRRREIFLTACAGAAAIAQSAIVLGALHRLSVLTVP